MDNSENRNENEIGNQQNQNLESSLDFDKKQSKAEIVQEKKPVKKEKSKYLWAIEIGVLSLFLSLMFSVLSEYLLSGANLIIVVFVVVILLFLNVFFDMIGLAFASCPIEPLYSMASRKIKGSKVAIALVKNADKVCSICSDVIGDICGILCGAAGVTIAVVITGSLTGAAEIVIGAVVSSVIAGLTILFKAFCKNVAINKPISIVMGVSRVLSIFSRKK